MFVICMGRHQDPQEHCVILPSSLEPPPGSGRGSSGYVGVGVLTDISGPCLLLQFNDLASLSLTLLDKEDIGDGRSSETDVDGRSLGEPLVKRERSDANHPLQGI